ncbi:MAG TPA: amidohydrolase, partial [Acidimicrobiia bacterium]|nr:amidohydrolase [Acidimicrobiia bacterium]
MEMKEASAAAFDAVERELVEISRWMYEHPETAFEEHDASRRLAGFLRDRGFDVVHPAHGLETAFRATIGSEGPEVVVCAEY